MGNKILPVTLGMLLGFGAMQPLRAQVKRISRSAPTRGALGVLAPLDSERSSSGQYSAADLEELRTQLLNLADTVKDFAAVAPPDLVDLDGLDQARTQIQLMPLQQLNRLRQGISPSKMATRLNRARKEVAGYADNVAQAREGKLRFRPQLSDPTTFPVVSGFCDPIGNAVASAIGGTNPGGSTAGPARIPVAVVLAADVTFFIADSVRELAQDACKETLVVAGEGGNTSLACTIVDIIWIVAKAVDEGIHFCDDDLTGNVIDTNYARLDDIHSDLYSTTTAIDTHLTNVNTDVDNKIAALDTHLTNVDTHIATEFATLSTLVTTLIGNLSAQLTASTNQIVAGERQIMKLDLTPDGLRQLLAAILTCDGTAANPCPNVLNQCPSGKCSWNNVGPLP